VEISLVKTSESIAGSKRSETEGESDCEPLHTPLNAEQARAWRRSHRQISVWVVVVVQCAAAVAATVLAWAVWGSVVAMSLGCGAFCVLMPSALFAWGMRSKLSRASPLAGFAVWELAKLGLSVALLLTVPRVLGELNWFALLGGLILTTKVLFVAALWPLKGGGEAG